MFVDRFDSFHHSLLGGEEVVQHQHNRHDERDEQKDVQQQTADVFANVLQPVAHLSHSVRHTHMYGN